MASAAWFNCAHACESGVCYVNGREYVLPDDVKYLSPFVLGHRLVLQTDVLGAQGEDTALIERVLKRVNVPATRKDIVR
ncbi:hypothetical protein [Geomicrobium sp. JCM 19039]|uniref:hypothetical protein n=1 Tax=Geomicrobium sp. JCM 19039 TaxID=1460636 RepID=UPI0035A6DDB3